jgi:hypothetical protein
VGTVHATMPLAGTDLRFGCMTACLVCCSGPSMDDDLWTHIRRRWVAGLGAVWRTDWGPAGGPRRMWTMQCATETTMAAAAAAAAAATAVVRQRPYGSIGHMVFVGMGFGPNIQ